MEEVVLALAPLFTLVFPAVVNRLRRKQRGETPESVSVELRSGEHIDLTQAERSLVREQINTVLESRPSRVQRIFARLNVQITPLQLVYGAVMLIGIAAKEVWDYDRANGRLGFELSKMSLALLVAPIVYTAVQPQLAPLHDSLTLVGMGVAFQNGFFWQSVFASVQGS